MAEEKPSPLSGIFTQRETSSENLGENLTDSVTPSSAEGNHQVGFASREQINQLYRDIEGANKSLVARVQQLEAAFSAMRGITALAILLSVYAVFKVRKLTAHPEGGSDGKILEEVQAGNTED